jgi:hypothetical protein
MSNEMEVQLVTFCFFKMAPSSLIPSMPVDPVRARPSSIDRRVTRQTLPNSHPDDPFLSQSTRRSSTSFRGSSALSTMNTIDSDVQTSLIVTINWFFVYFWSSFFFSSSSCPLSRSFYASSISRLNLLSFEWRAVTRRLIVFPVPLELISMRPDKVSGVGVKVTRGRSTSVRLVNRILSNRNYCLLSLSFSLSRPPKCRPNKDE